MPNNRLASGDAPWTGVACNLEHNPSLSKVDTKYFHTGLREGL